MPSRDLVFIGQTKESGRSYTYKFLLPEQVTKELLDRIKELFPKVDMSNIDIQHPQITVYPNGRS